ncbi:hypothetical protein [Bacillus subtilis]|uniref:hypothetical protein n=1 Tax=Bacillus subtilis TaxID=1423 RepID=UPI00129E16A1|nr:hypothetical protein [Bacillus subtilis]MEC2217460.1 hypothetical protein [Bacillus subtilis]QGI15747.1 hypothetical protein GII80_22025 [Bacillus subtilis]CAF1775679.1 hypothetical protein NRS6092_04141 [Bacillus subtilis]CAF1851403.1 hypothetical protein NRS6134_03978 [Bacillus subtilis]CAI6329571.1 hypothetical protein NRS6134_21535 [Bacillus subtilis]
MTDELLKLMKSLSEKFDNGFEKIDKRFDSVEKRLDNIEQRLEMMTEKESNTNEDVIVLLKKIDKQTIDITKDIEYLSGQVGKHDMILNRFKN